MDGGELSSDGSELTIERDDDDSSSVAPKVLMPLQMNLKTQERPKRNCRYGTGASRGKGDSTSCSAIPVSRA